MATIVNPHRMELGLQLEEYRKASGLTAQAIEQHERIRWTRGKFSKVKLGQGIPSPAEVHVLADLFGLTKDERERLVALADLARRKTASSATTPWAQSSVSFEQTAAGIDFYGEELLPPVLTTELYARRLVETNPDADVDAWVRDRMRRAAILDKPDAPRVRVLISEGALRRIPEEGAREQLERLWHPAVELRIIPFSRGLHRLIATPFVIYHMASGLVTAYREGVAEGEYLRDAEAQTYAGVFQDIWSATGRDESETILRGHILRATEA